uniref:Novel immune-type receptor 10a n=1 Tax=Sinocyclocheilus anshuiensis TaxID=1608454 RepID=A0A671SNY5_9TELE
MNRLWIGPMPITKCNIISSPADVQPVLENTHITMWCPHNIHVTGNLYWFKQSDGAVPVTIVHMLYTESLQKVEPNYFNSFTNDCIVMDQFSKSTTLTIKQVKISDSGFYFCGATGYHMKFGTGTRLEVKASLKRFHSNYIHSFTDHEQSPVSTEECSRDIYFKLTLLFGGIIFFTCIVPLILAIIREHRRQKHKKDVDHHETQQHEPHSSVYAALQ